MPSNNEITESNESNENALVALEAMSTEITTFVNSMAVEVKSIEEKYADIVPEPDTKSGYKFCKEVRTKVLPIKTKLENDRKLLKAPLLKMGKTVDGSLNPLIDKLASVYKPFVDAYQKKDNEKKVKEEQRQEIVNKGFQRLNDAAMQAIGQTSIVIETTMDDLGDFDFDPDVFMERTDEAVRKHRELMGSLQTMLKAQLDSEELALHQKEIKQKEEEQLLIRENAKREERDAKIREEAIKSAKIKAEADAEIAKKALMLAEEKAEQEIKSAEIKAKSDAAIAKENLRLAEVKLVEDAKLAKERASQAQIKAQADAIVAAIDAEIQANKREEQAAQQERQRLWDEKQMELAETARRGADKKHKAKIHREILTSIMKTGITVEQAKAIITMAAKKCAGNMWINY